MHRRVCIGQHNYHYSRDWRARCACTMCACVCVSIRIIGVYFAEITTCTQLQRSDRWVTITTVYVCVCVRMRTFVIIMSHVKRRVALQKRKTTRFYSNSSWQIDSRCAFCISRQCRVCALFQGWLWADYPNTIITLQMYTTWLSVWWWRN